MANLIGLVSGKKGAMDFPLVGGSLGTGLGILGFANDDVFKKMKRMDPKEQVLVEYFNIISCLEYFQPLFPSDCVREIFSYLPQCSYCRRAVIRKVELMSLDIIHPACEEDKKCPFECTVCGQKVERQQGMMHDKCREDIKMSICIRKMHKFKRELRYRFKKGKSTKNNNTIIIPALLVKNLDILIPKPEKVDMYVEVIKSDEGSQRKISIDQSSEIPQPYCVHLVIVKGVLFIVFKKKGDTSPKGGIIFLLRPDQMSVLMRLIKDDIFVRTPKNEDGTFDFPKKISQEDKVLMSKNTYIRDMAFTVDGFLSEFLQIHGVWGTQDEEPKIQFTDPTYLKNHIFSRELMLHPEVNLTVERVGHNNKYVVFPGETLHCHRRPMCSFYSRLNRKEHIPVIHAHLVFMDTIFKTNKYSQLMTNNGMTDPKVEDPNEEIMIKPLVLFDGCFFEWDNNELLLPKKSLSFTMPLCRCHMMSFPVTKPYEAYYYHGKAAKIVNKYNTLYKFKEVNPNLAGGERNGFNFAEDFLTEIIENYNSHVGEMKRLFHNKLVEDMRNNGKAGLTLTYTERFKEHYKLNEDGKTFRTHKELDSFVQSVDEISFRLDFKLEYDILMTFDAIFWSRHILWPENESYKPKTGRRNRVICPFSDPKKVKAFKNLYF